MRKEILNRLPVADVCLLEETPFMDGLDLEFHWRSCLSLYPGQMMLCPDLQEICEANWRPTQFAKACFYSGIAASVLNSTTNNLGYAISEGVQYSLSYGNFYEVSALCFAVRSVISETGPCEFSFPPRYAKYNFCRDLGQVNVAVDAFKGHPRLLKLGFNMTERFPFHMSTFLSDLEYLEIHVSKKSRFKVALRVFEQTTNCKFLSIEYTRGNVSSKDITKLPKSSLDVLIISKLVLMEESFHQLLQCFLSVPCDHPQKLTLDQVSMKGITGKIECNQTVQHPQNVSYWPELEVTDRRYLHLKTVELKNCTIKTSELVLQWPITRGENEDNHDQQDGGKNSKRKQKRPASTRAKAQRASKRLRKK